LLFADFKCPSFLKSNLVFNRNSLFEFELGIRFSIVVLVIVLFVLFVIELLLLSKKIMNKDKVIETYYCKY